ncbi:MAG: CapA family protein, partial [Oscillospiraceae bacterium]|nr:CapA family protein [Oscillospiraceae bacterium]
TAAQQTAFDNAFRITFAGDLILLEDQVKRGFDGETYDFSDVFAYAESYISSADLTVGVFEGPLAGEEAGYTGSNFDDGKELRLNFPDAFAQAVRDAGFDLVTTANNHLLDKDTAGVMRTLDTLDAIGLDHTGSYRNAQDKQQNRVKLLECQGIRFAVLSYTYGSNDIITDDLAEPDGRYAALTSLICGTEGELFERLKASVEQDFRDAKALNPDLILVLPHIGTQFSNGIDGEQQVWFEIFRENGADIILGDHPHAVEPALIEEYNGRKVFTAYCPGNFANIYREQQGDTSMLTEVYIDRGTKQVIGGGIVPLYTFAPADGNFSAVPVYGIQNDPALRARLTTDDIDRAANANAIVTKVVFGHRMDLSAVTERYYFNENGFLRTKAGGLELTEQMKRGTLYQAMQRAESVCFIGDSVTEGTKNGGCPWYEPLTEYFPEKTLTNYSHGGCTVSYMTEHIAEIPEASLYVIALGTNDVRYRNAEVCAMTPKDFVLRLDALKAMLLTRSPGAAFVFVAPWYSTDGDPYCPLNYADKTALNESFCAELEQYCGWNSFGFVNANGIIRETLSAEPERTYLLDHIHPNASKGVLLYTEAALLQGAS